MSESSDKQAFKPVFRNHIPLLLTLIVFTIELAVALGNQQETSLWLWSTSILLRFPAAFILIVLALDRARVQFTQIEFQNNEWRIKKPLHKKVILKQEDLSGVDAYPHLGVWGVKFVLKNGKIIRIPAPGFSPIQFFRWLKHEMPELCLENVDRFLSRMEYLESRGRPYFAGSIALIFAVLAGFLGFSIFREIDVIHSVDALVRSPLAFPQSPLRFERAVEQLMAFPVPAIPLAMIAILILCMSFDSFRLRWARPFIAFSSLSLLLLFYLFASSIAGNIVFSVYPGSLYGGMLNLALAFLVLGIRAFLFPKPLGSLVTAGIAAAFLLFVPPLHHNAKIELNNSFGDTNGGPLHFGTQKGDSTFFWSVEQNRKGIRYGQSWNEQGEFLGEVNFDFLHSTRPEVPVHILPVSGDVWLAGLGNILLEYSDSSSTADTLWMGEDAEKINGIAENIEGYINLSPDRKRVAFATTRHPLVVVELDSGRVSYFRSQGNRSLYFLEWASESLIYVQERRETLVGSKVKAEYDLWTYSYSGAPVNHILRYNIGWWLITDGSPGQKRFWGWDEENFATFEPGKSPQVFKLPQQHGKVGSFIEKITWLGSNRWLIVEKRINEKRRRSPDWNFYIWDDGRVNKLEVALKGPRILDVSSSQSQVAYILLEFELYTDLWQLDTRTENVSLERLARFPWSFRTNRNLTKRGFLVFVPQGDRFFYPLRTFGHGMMGSGDYAVWKIENE
ncbi:hypothetical protein K8I28_02890 [bacterium]|nr:hypothetical protein [bacterium]